MIIRFAGALGVAALAFSLSLGNSSACPKAAEESVTGDRVADVGLPASDIAEPKIGGIVPLTEAEESAPAPAIDSAVAALPVDTPETATFVARGQKPDDSEIEPSTDLSETSALAESDLAEWKLIFEAASAPAAALIEDSPATASATIAAILGKMEPSSDVNEPSTPELQAAAGVLTESDIAEWKLIFDGAPAATVMEGSPGTAPATIGAAEAIPSETVEANSPASDEKPAAPEIDITGPVPQHTAATEDLE